MPSNNIYDETTSAWKQVGGASVKIEKIGNLTDQYYTSMSLDTFKAKAAEAGVLFFCIKNQYTLSLILLPTQIASIPKTNNYIIGQLDSSTNVGVVTPSGSPVSVTLWARSGTGSATSAEVYRVMIG